MFPARAARARPNPAPQPTGPAAGARMGVGLRRRPGCGALAFGVRRWWGVVGACVSGGPRVGCVKLSAPACAAYPRTACILAPAAAGGRPPNPSLPWCGPVAAVAVRGGGAGRWRFGRATELLSFGGPG
jgi:hypothetical protein